MTALAAPSSLEWQQDRPAHLWRVVAIGVCAVSSSLALAAMALQARHGIAPRNLSYWIMDVVTALVYGGVTLLMLPRSRHVVAWIMALTALGCGLSAFATQYVLLSRSGVDLPALGLAYPASGWVWVPGTVSAMAITPWVVSERRWPRWAIVVVASVVVAIGLSVVSVATTQYVGAPPNPLAVTGTAWTDVTSALGLWPDRFCVVVSLAGTAFLLWRWFTEPPARRRGLGWLTVGQCFMALAFVPVVMTMPTSFADDALELSGAALIVAQAFLPAALLVVVLGQRLWGIDVAVSRATVWLLLTGLVVAGYVAIAWAGTRLVPGNQELAGLVAVGVVAVAGQPLRHWVQRRVDRLVYGVGADPATLLSSLGNRLNDATREHSSLESLVDGLRHSLRLGYVDVRSPGHVLHASAGEPDGPTIEVPLVIDGRRTGAMRVAPRTGERLDQRTEVVLGQVAGLVAVALELAQVNEDLEDARDRLVEVRHEERRLLRRELHDGLGPALAGIGLGMAAMDNLKDIDPDAMADLLTELRAELKRRTEDVRAIARTLLPPALDDGDLDGALGTLAGRLSTHGFDVRTNVEVADDLEVRRQVAIYHIAAEAVLNAHRHAGATSCLISVESLSGDGVALTVSDDGRGIGPGSTPGIGLTSMRERAEELGGTCVVSSEGVGTRVQVMLP